MVCAVLYKYPTDTEPYVVCADVYIKCIRAEIVLDFRHLATVHSILLGCGWPFMVFINVHTTHSKYLYGG